MVSTVSTATEPGPQRGYRRRLILIGGALVGVAVAAFFYLRSPSPGDARAFVPSDVRTAAVIPSLRSFHGGATSFLAGVEGAGGLLELGGREIGLDLSSPDALEGQGVWPDGSLVVFRWADTWAMNVSVSSLARFAEEAQARAVQGLGGESIFTEQSPDGMLGAVRLPSGLGLGWGAIHDEGVGTVVLSTTSAGLDAAWTRLAQAPVGPIEGASPHGIAWAVLDAEPTLPATLGPLALVLSSYVSPLSRWTAVLHADGAGLRLGVDGAWQGSGAPPLSFFHTKAQGKPLRSYLPRSTTGLLSFSWRPQSLASMPLWIRAKALPSKLPGLAGAVLPTTHDLLELVHGDMAFAAFGLSRTHDVDLARMPAGLTELFTKTIGVGFFVRAADGGRVAAVLAGVAQGLASRGWTVTPITQGPWTGFDLHTSRPEQHWSLVARDDVAALVTASELPGLMDVAKGAAASHWKADPAAQADGHPTVGVHLAFSRIARELGIRGVPPYFLRMLSGLEAVGLETRLHEKGIRFALEIGL